MKETSWADSNSNSSCKNNCKKKARASRRWFGPKVSFGPGLELMITFVGRVSWPLYDSETRDATRRDVTRKKYSHVKWWVQFFMSPPSYTGYHCCAASAALNCEPLMLSLSLSLTHTHTHSHFLTLSLSLSWAHFSKSMTFRRCMKEGVCEFQTRVSSQLVLSELLKSELSALLNREIKTI